MDMSIQNFDQMSWEDLMAFEAERSKPLVLSDEQVKLFNFRTILYQIEQNKYRLPLLPEAGSAADLIKDILAQMHAEGYLELGSDAYRMTNKGREELQNMAEQYHSMVEHYEIFAAVDLDNSCFLEADDDRHQKVMIDGQEYDRFIDLRVAVMRFKGTNPFDMIFLTLLRENRIATQPNWEFDMALGKELYKEIEEIVNSAYSLQDLTNLHKQNDNGDIPGSDILKDVIRAGNDINRERKAQAEQTPSAPARRNGHSESHYVTETVEVYEPFYTYEYVPYDYYDYYTDPFYVEPCWRHHHYYD